MSKFLVISAFQDKFTKVHYAKGSYYESNDSERVAFLQEEGFLDREPLEAPVIVESEVKTKKPKRKSNDESPSKE
jgi:hypothetical protein